MFTGIRSSPHWPYVMLNPADAGEVDPPLADPYTIINEAGSGGAGIAYLSIELPSDQEEIIIVGDIAPELDSSRVHMEFSTDNKLTWDTVSGNYTGVLMGGAQNSGSAVIRTGKDESTISRGLGQEYGLTFSIRISKHANADAYTQYMIDGSMVAPNDMLRMNNGCGVHKVAGVVTHARLIFHQGNISAVNYMAIGGPAGAFLPFTEPEVTSLKDITSVKIPFDSSPETIVEPNPMYNISGLDIRTATDDDYAEMFLTTGSDQLINSGYTYHNNKSHSDSTSYSSNAQGDDPSIVLHEQLGSDSLSAYSPNILVPGLHTYGGIKYKALMDSGMSIDMLNVDPRIHMSYSAMSLLNIEQPKSFFIQCGLSFFTEGKINLRELALHKTSDVGKSHGPFTLEGRYDMVDMVDLEISLTSSKLRHYFVLIDIDADVDNARVDYQLEQDGAYVTNNKYHIHRSTGLAGGYVSSKASSSTYAQFLRGLSVDSRARGHAILELTTNGALSGYAHSKAGIYSSDDTAGMSNGCLRTNSGSVVTGIKFLASAGTIQGMLLHYTIG